MLHANVFKRSIAVKQLLLYTTFSITDGIVGNSSKQGTSLVSQFIILQLKATLTNATIANS